MECTATPLPFKESKLTPLPDQLLAQAVQAIRETRLADAEQDIERLLTLEPNFRLAQLIRADLLLARTAPLQTLGAVDDRTARKERSNLDDLREEARARLKRYLQHPDPRLMPSAVLQIAPQHPYVLLADAQRSRLYVFENLDGEPRLLKDYYLSVGREGTDKRVEGDKKTPLGVYQITSRIPGRKLSDFYGPGAFPLNYPNALDQAQGRTGHGIWLHGVPANTFSRAPNSSDGCLVVSNDDWRELRRYVHIGNTPMIIAPQIDWLERSTWVARRLGLLTSLKGLASESRLRHSNLFIHSAQHLALAEIPQSRWSQSHRARSHTAAQRNHNRNSNQPTRPPTQILYLKQRDSNTTQWQVVQLDALQKHPLGIPGKLAKNEH